MIKHVFKSGTTDINKAVVPSEVVNRVRDIVERGRTSGVIRTSSERTKKTG